MLRTQHAQELLETFHCYTYISHVVELNTATNFAADESADLQKDDRYIVFYDC